MKKLLKISYQILKNNMIFIQPFLIYLMVLMLAMPYLINKNGSVYPKIILLVSVILLSVANWAGWLYINKKAVEDYREDDTKEQITIKTVKNFKLYFFGVGEKFFKTLFGFILFVIFYVSIFYGITKICLIALGEPIIAANIKELANLKTTAEMTQFLNGFSSKDVLVFTLWTLILSFSALFINFLGMLYFTILFSENYNFFKSFFKMLIFFFKNFFKSIYIIIFMFMLYILLNSFAMVLGTNSIGFTVLIILGALYLNYYIILLLCFYNERTKNNIDIGSELYGQN